VNFSSKNTAILDVTRTTQLCILIYEILHGSVHLLLQHINIVLCTPKEFLSKIVASKLLDKFIIFNRSSEQDIISFNGFVGTFIYIYVYVYYIFK
jgi:hypothetical protein